MPAPPTTRAEKMRHAVDVAGRLTPETGRYSIDSAAGSVAIHGTDGGTVREAGGHLAWVTEDRPHGWFRVEDVCPGWVRYWHATIDGIDITAVERHDEKVHGPLPQPDPVGGAS